MSKCIKSSSQDLLMLSLSKFYKKKENIQYVLPIINGNSDISLRLIDWFVTNYSKKKSTNIPRYDACNNVYYFNVYLSYRSQLKAYSKQSFDPFRRRERIEFFYDKEKYIETTIGQMNFFRWIIENDILTYITKNIKDIEEDMLSIQKKSDKLNAKKRNELSTSFIKNMNKTSGLRVIAFN